MNDTSIFDDAGYAEYLLSASIVRQGLERFYVGWVREFYNRRRQWAGYAWYDQLPLFVNYLQNCDKYADWQIHQAEQSVRLYFSTFLKEKGDIDKPQPLVAIAEDGGFTIETGLQVFYQSLRLKNYSLRTEKTYLQRVKDFLRYSAQFSPDSKSFNCEDIEGCVKNYLAHLAIHRKVSATTQNQAFNALVTFFRLVLHHEISDMRQHVRAKTGTRLPVVFSQKEVKQLLTIVKGAQHLALSLIYGGGLRVQEFVRLRIQDVDFDQNLLYVRSGKGNKDRTTLLPKAVVPRLKEHMKQVLDLHASDVREGFGTVWLPNALARKYPKAATAAAWQWLFPAAKRSIDPRSGKIRRHHVQPRAIQRALKVAMQQADINKHATVHTLRHSFATHLLLAGVDIRQIQEYLGHARVETTMIYTHVIKDMRDPAVSPLDCL